jgi:hypothetical protein
MFDSFYILHRYNFITIPVKTASYFSFFLLIVQVPIKNSSVRANDLRQAKPWKRGCTGIKKKLCRCLTF